jgi:hypothetical protein
LLEDCVAGMDSPRRGCAGTGVLCRGRSYLRSALQDDGRELHVRIAQKIRECRRHGVGNLIEEALPFGAFCQGGADGEAFATQLNRDIGVDVEVVLPGGELTRLGADRGQEEERQTLQRPADRAAIGAELLDNALCEDPVFVGLIGIFAIGGRFVDLVVRVVS